MLLRTPTHHNPLPPPPPQVKLEPEPFASGAMRVCFRMKKLSNFGGTVYRDWRRAANFVAKM